MIDLDKGLSNLDYLLKNAGLLMDSEEYLDFVGWQRQLKTIIECERRYTVLSPQEQAHRERILRELDRIALRYSGNSLINLCAKKNLNRLSTKPTATSVSNPVISSVPVVKSRFENAYALIIGVSSYIHPFFSELPATINDVNALTEILTDKERCGYIPTNVWVLEGRNTTTSCIKKSLSKLSKSTNSNSTVFIYFSGHGGGLMEKGKWRTFLCPCDVLPDKIEKTAISGENFSSYLADIPAQKMLVILDACHAGGSVEFKTGGIKISWKSGLPEDFYEKLSRGSGRVVIASSKENQYSYIHSLGDLSLFTWHLREALKGGAGVRGDGVIHVLDLFHYVNEAVRAEEPQQTPIMKANDVDLNFPIAFHH